MQSAALADALAELSSPFKERDSTADSALSMDDFVMGPTVVRTRRLSCDAISCLKPNICRDRLGTDSSAKVGRFKRRSCFLRQGIGGYGTVFLGRFKADHDGGRSKGSVVAIKAMGKDQLLAEQQVRPEKKKATPDKTID